MTAKGRRFEEREDFADAFAESRGVREVVQRDLAEQPALRSWLLFCRKEDRSIASNAKEKDQEQQEE